ncbi:MAG TPA: histidine kinase [Actinomadura sp.]|nr:histidine kinase [Actinomadura sp.]
MSGREILRPLIARSTWRRWAYLVGGGALLLPYFILSMALMSGIGPAGRDDVTGALLSALFVLVIPLPAVFVTGLVPAVRVLEGTAVRELVGGPITEHAIVAARSWAARWRTACWFCVHLGAGVLTSALSLAVLSGVPALIVLPLWGRRHEGGPIHGWDPAAARLLGPVLALLCLVAFGYAVVGAGALLARLAPLLLGPTPAERLAALEQRALRLAERNRLARELHDSVGHALSIVTLQAGAAGRVLHSDPDFARQALGAIEESARGALEDLDHVLGLLREDSGSTAPQPTLADLGGLLDQSRMAGVELDAEIEGDLSQVPAVVSREAYRIVQEGLTNALRHAGKVPVGLRLTVRTEQLEVEMTNPIGVADERAGRPGGGRGLRGIRERVTVLRGRMTAGAEGPRWRIDVSLPLRSTP